MYNRAGGGGLCSFDARKGKVPNAKKNGMREENW